MNLNTLTNPKKIDDEQLYESIKNNWGEINKEWVSHQFGWLNNIYSPFKDHAKYLIIIHLVEKTMKFYTQNFISYNYDKYYEKKYIEVEKFNITEISKKFDLPKETVRRKIQELEKINVLKRIKKTVILDRSAFTFVKPEKQIQVTSSYISRIIFLLNTEKSLNKKVENKYVEKKIRENFTTIWSWFYELQIPWIMAWNSYFKDFSLFHIFGACTFNQICNSKSDQNKSGSKFIDVLNQELIDNKNNAPGLSAMSLSDMTSIPRATIIRKCKILIDRGTLKLNDKNQYLLTGFNLTQESIIQKNLLKRKVKFLSKTINFLMVE